MSARRLIGAQRRLADFWDRRRLKVDEFSIISSDCWGAEVYQALELPYRTPFVGLMVHGPCFMALLGDLRGNLEQELRFSNTTQYPEVELRRKETTDPYPIGVLDLGIEIHFLHERTQRAAAEKWNRRRDRIAWDRLFLKLSADKDYVTHEHLRAFDVAPFEKKVAFTRTEYPDIRCAVRVGRWVEDGALMYRRARTDFDAVGWINGDSGSMNRIQRATRSTR